MTAVKTYLTVSLLKPAIAGVTAAALDRYALINANVNGNLYFGASVAAGIASVAWVSPFIDKPGKDTLLDDVGKSLQGRVLEIASATGAAYAVNHFVMRNNYSMSDWMSKCLVIACADMVGETVSMLVLHPANG